MKRRATYVANPRPDHLPKAIALAALVLAATAVALWVLALAGVPIR